MGHTKICFGLILATLFHFEMSAQSCFTVDFSYEIQFNGCTVQFEATEPQGASNYSWNFGDGASASGATVSHSFQEANCFDVELEVSFAGATTSEVKTICLQSCNNNGVLSVAINGPETAMTNKSYQYSATTYGGVLPIDLTWTFYDAISSGNTGLGSHDVEFTDDGLIDICVSAEDSEGQIAETSLTVNVDEVEERFIDFDWGLAVKNMPVHFYGDHNPWSVVGIENFSWAFEQGPTINNATTIESNT